MDKRKLEEEKSMVKLKDPYWVGQDVRRKYTIRKDRIDIGQKRVVLRLFDAATGRIMARINLGCRSIDDGFLGWDMMTDYPVTLYQVGREAILSLHRSQGTEEICLTIERPR